MQVKIPRHLPSQASNSDNELHEWTWKQDGSVGGVGRSWVEMESRVKGVSFFGEVKANGCPSHSPLFSYRAAGSFATERRTWTGLRRTRQGARMKF